MRAILSLFLVIAMGCATSQTAAPVRRTLPPPIVSTELPPTPEQDKPIPPSEDWAVPVEEGDVAERAGILLSTDKATRASYYVIRYNELRALYAIDLNTWERERDIYEQHLVLAQEEADAWRERAKRTWFEENKGTIGLVSGLVLGVVASVAATMAINKAAD